MVKYISLFVLCIAVSIQFTLANDVPKRIILSGYTYSCANRTVGAVEILGSNSQKIRFQLKGKYAKRFIIDANNQLSVKKNQCNSNVPWYDLTVQADIDGHVMTDTFRIVKDMFVSNKVVAHRGAWKHTGETENSIGSLKKAIEMGCEMSELDVNLSGDGVLFVNHDATIQGVKIDTANSSLLSSIKLPNGEYLPTLETYIKETMKQFGTRLLVEVKPFSVSKARGLEAAEATVELVRQMHAQAWVCYISFSYDILKKIRELDPYAKIAYLNGDKTPEEIKESGFWGIDYYYSRYQKNLEWMEQAENLGLTVNSWVVNTSELMDWFIKMDIRYITTDEPEMLFNKLNEKN